MLEENKESLSQDVKATQNVDGTKDFDEYLEISIENPNGCAENSSVKVSVKLFVSYN